MQRTRREKLQAAGGPLNLPLINLIPLAAAIALAVGIVVMRRLLKPPEATMSDASNT